nr:MAG TPA: Interleukin-6 receptor subunit beta-like, FNIII, Cell membrane, Disulfide [Caudoviricetes sp.]
MPTFKMAANGMTAVSAEFPDKNYSNLTEFTFGQTPFSEVNADCAYVSFAKPAGTEKYKKIRSFVLHIFATPLELVTSSSGAASIQIYAIGTAEQKNISEITKNNQPALAGVGERATKAATATGTTTEVALEWKENSQTIHYYGLQALRNGVCTLPVLGYSGNIKERVTLHGPKQPGKAPYIIVTYADTTAGLTVNGMSPTNGAYVARGKASTFTWNTGCDDLTLEEIKQASAIFEWRIKNGSTSKTISVSGATASCTVPANTFPSGTLEWRVKVTANSGTTTTSTWQEITTTEVTPTAKPVSPSGIVIDATISNRFSWQHIISTGTPQSKADLQWSADGTTWNTLATVTGENQYYDVPANTFTSGTKYWRVRTYNTDNTASEWSDKAEFIAINAPSAPSIVIQSTGPRPRITWQTTEQEAYQLTLSNGYASGTVYGTEKAWRSPVYLADGSYTVRVRVQNKYGMWSEWSAAALPVSHTEGEAITLTITAGHEAALTWQTAGSYDFYLIERDGVAIARTAQKEYIDHTSIDSVTYRVRGCYDESDNYGVSNSDTVEILPETNMICDLETGVWLEMRLSETQLRTNSASFSAGVSTVHLAGLAYPVEERSEQRDRALSVACAWPHAQRAAALALEALVGRLVCLKDRYGNMVVGSLPSLESNCDEFMRRYSFTISHTNREEAITLDP